MDKRRRFGGQGGLVALQLDEVDSDEHIEGGEGYDLEDDTSQHDIAAHIGDLVGAGRGSDAAADSLEEEGEDVARDEDVGVQLRLDDGELGTDGADDVFENQI